MSNHGYLMKKIQSKLIRIGKIKTDTYCNNYVPMYYKCRYSPIAVHTACCNAQSGHLDIAKSSAYSAINLCPTSIHFIIHYASYLLCLQGKYPFSGFS